MTSMVNSVGSEITIPPITNFGSNVQSGPSPARSGGAKGQSDPRQVGEVVKELNDAVRIINTNLSFSVDEPTGETVIKVVDADTKKVIRQIPAEEMLRAAARIKDLLGALFDKTR